MYTVHKPTLEQQFHRTAEASISRESKVGSNVLEWYPHLMSEKTKTKKHLLFVPSRPISRNQFCRLTCMVGFCVDGHIYVYTCIYLFIFYFLFFFIYFFYIYIFYFYFIFFLFLFYFIFF